MAAPNIIALSASGEPVVLMTVPSVPNPMQAYPGLYHRLQHQVQPTAQHQSHPQNQHQLQASTHLQPQPQPPAQARTQVQVQSQSQPQAQAQAQNAQSQARRELQALSQSPLQQLGPRPEHGVPAASTSHHPGSVEVLLQQVLQQNKAYNQSMHSKIVADIQIIQQQFLREVSLHSGMLTRLQPQLSARVNERGAQIQTQLQMVLGRIGNGLREVERGSQARLEGLLAGTRRVHEEASRQVNVDPAGWQRVQSALLAALNNGLAPQAPVPAPAPAALPAPPNGIPLAPPPRYEDAIGAHPAPPAPAPAPAPPAERQAPPPPAAPAAPAVPQTLSSFPLIPP
ncbi:hypothetical protein A4X13_0g9033, partial [Tilletia indica]